MTKEEVHHLIENNTCMELLLLVNKRLSFAVILIYRHPHGNFISFMESLENILSHKVLFQYSNVIICGDININLFETTNRVKQYKTLIKSFNYDFLLKEPTHKSDSCIDHIISTIRNREDLSTKICDFQVTDHKAISISFNTKTDLSRNTLLKRVYNKRNIDNFCSKISQINWFDYINIEMDLNKNTDIFIKQIMLSYYECFPLTNKNKQKPNTWIDNKLREMIAKKKYLLRQVKRKNKIEDKTQLKYITKAIKQYINTLRINYYKEFFISRSSKERWNEINKLVQLKQKTTSKESDLNAQKFGTFFSSIFSTSSNTTTPTVNRFCENTIFMTATNEAEITNCFASFKKKMTSQEHDIPMKLWRIIAQYIIKPTEFLVNQMLSSATFPDIFKHAILTPIYKKGNCNEAQNFRPIATLHNLSKVFERILLNRMVNFCEKQHILPINQYGFRAKHSTRDAILTLLLSVEKNSLNNLKSCAIFLDLSKAFDLVNHDMLLKILYNQGFRGHFHSLLNNYLKGRSYKVKFQQSYSDVFKIKKGVPQGSLISPILYSIYVHDLILIHSNTIQYADDTSFIIPYKTMAELQNTLNFVGCKIERYMTQRQLKLNKNKTEIILFNHTHTESLNFMNEKITTSRTAKFLGIILESNKSFNSHITNVVIPNIRKLYKIFFQLSTITNFPTKKLIFNSFILPHILYATPFILNCDKGHSVQLQRAFNKSIKLLFRLPHLFPSHLLSSKTNTPCLSKYVTTYSLLYAHKLHHTPLESHKPFFKTTKRHNFIIDPHKDSNSIHNKISEIWNILPSSIKEISKTQTFKTHIHESL